MCWIQGKVILAWTTGCLFFSRLYFLVQSHEPSSYVDDARAPLFSVPGLRATCQNIHTSTVYDMLDEAYLLHTSSLGKS